MEQQTQREQLSALADGELPDEEWAQALDFAASDEGRETWQLYQLVGDVLRSPELARQTHDDGGAFMARLRQNLAQEPTHNDHQPPPHSTPVTPVLAHNTIALPTAVAPKAAANDSVFRWKLVAGVASLATVASLAWSTWGSSGNPGAATGQWAAVGTAPTTQEVVQAKPVATPVTTENPVTVAQTERPNQPSAAPVMLRDPRLDELLAAHQQFHGASALQLPAGFLRNANFESPKR
ncbi:sigma-E factor negative regulatory protein [Giesbergeria sinuosa]|uniref:Sigma-E factor negative regulatory protein n=2 Tax=Giesbergeria sinuosa TaxID=80883 RepID=A0ABV9QB64_9BURK